MTGSRWSSAICERPPYAPGVVHWSAGLIASATGLFVTLYAIADKHIPIEQVEDAQVRQIVVSLGAPAQRLEPPPPELIPDTPPDEAPPPQMKTERAEEAPPPEPRYFAPVQQATGALSSGFGQTVETETPPAPPPKVELSRTFINVSTAKYVSLVNYPYNALRKRIEGTGHVKVEIDRSGRVEHWRIVRSTGSPVLDREIERVCKQVDRLDPLPDDYPFPHAKVIIPFSFVMAD